MYKVTAMGGESVSDTKVKCDRPGCDEWFTKKTHNQRYHNDECCRLATNAKIMEKYYERRAQRLGHTRMCKSCNTTKLSRYNDDQICSPCKAKKQIARNSSVLDMLSRAALA